MKSLGSLGRPSVSGRVQGNAILPRVEGIRTSYQLVAVCKDFAISKACSWKS